MGVHQSSNRKNPIAAISPFKKLVFQQQNPTENAPLVGVVSRQAIAMSLGSEMDSVEGQKASRHVEDRNRGPGSTCPHNG